VQATIWSLLTAVQFSNPDQGLVAGGDQCGGDTTHCSGAIYRTSTAGASWSLVSSPSTPFIDNLSCAPGGSGPCMATSTTFTAIQPGRAKSNVDDGSVILESTNGNQWQTLETVSGPNFPGVACPDQTQCIVVGGVQAANSGTVLAEKALLATNSRVSTIASTLPTPSEAFSPASSVVVNGGIAAAIAMVLTFPSQLFNETFRENYAEIVGWWRRKLRRLTGRTSDEEEVPPKKTGPSIRRDRALFGAVVLAGALVNSFNDGHFGFHEDSLITFLAVTLTLVAGVAVSGAIAGLYHSKRHGDTSRRLVALPAGLAIAAVLVVFSRIIGFEPGYLYGVVCGVIFTKKLADNEEGHLAALGVLTTLAVSVAAWIAWVPVNTAAEHHGASFGVVLADDFLAALFVSGLVGAFFGMIPIKGLPGWTVRRWNLRAWAVGFALAVFGPFQILLRPGIAGHGHRPLVASVILFVAFGVGSIAFHEHFEDKKRRAEGEDHPSVGERARTVLRHARLAPAVADTAPVADAPIPT
jgi:hypothetical protein